MTKWKCDRANAMCFKPCYAEIEGCEGMPRKCLFGDARTPKWERVPDKPEQKPEAELPKLTAEVFDRSDCPEWATCAFVEKDGNAFYSSALHMAISDKGECWGGADFQDENLFLRIEGKWDATDWQNSLIERPAKLPDWVEIGGYVYSPRNGYGKIIRGSVKSCYIEFNGGAGDFTAESVAQLFLQARLRPWMPEEAVGKVVYVSKCCYLITSADEFMSKVGSEFIRLDRLADRYFQPDGSPCGVLEHLEDGEWVE